jgi:hypothetical protein
MLNMMIAILMEKGILDEEDGLALIEKLKYATMPGDFASSHAMIKKVFAQIEKER